MYLCVFVRICVCAWMCGGSDLLFHITPSTGDDVDKKYIYLDLQVSLSKEVCVCVAHLRICVVTVNAAVPSEPCWSQGVTI